MELTDLQRLKKIVKWLIFSGFGDNEKEIAELLGYKKSSFSQIMNGKVPISDKFIDNITSIDSNINKVWIKTGEGSMLKNEVVTSNNNKYIAMLEKNNALLEAQVKDKEKINALQEKVTKLEAEIRALKSTQSTTVNQFNQPSQDKPLTQPRH